MDEARALLAADWGAHKTALHEASPVPRGTIRGRLLGPMDPEVARSFTESQVRELERVLTAPSSARLPVDIRISVPLFRRGFFITFLAGPERRSVERRLEERTNYSLWSFWNIWCFVFLLALFIPTFIGLVPIFANGV